MHLIKSPLFDPDEFFKNFSEMQHLAANSFVPAMDIYKEKNNLIAKLPIADFDPKNIDIEIEDNILNIKGKTEKKSEVEEKDYFRKEIKSGSFSRSVMLPAEVEEDKAKSEYENGVLKVIIPMKKENKAKGRKIAVDVKKS